MPLVERDGFTVFEDKNLEECSHGIAPKEDCYYCLQEKKKKDANTDTNNEGT